MRKAAVLALLLLAGCGADDEPSGMAPERAEAETEPEVARTDREPAPAGTRIVARGSDFGTMLWGPGRRAIYIFERDGRGRSRCYGECAKAWPPVYTRGRPRAGPGVRRGLLGTTRRRDGRFQVTYAGQPLYLYAHEGPGEVLCHNVDLNGGLWWVVGPGGRRRP